MFLFQLIKKIAESNKQQRFYAWCCFVCACGKFLVNTFFYYEFHEILDFSQMAHFREELSVVGWKSWKSFQHALIFVF